MFDIENRAFEELMPAHMLEEVPIEAQMSRSRRPEPVIQGYTFREVAMDEMAFPEYLVKGLIDKGEVAFIFGESGTMKSFVTTDLAFHIATGRDWHGHRIAEPEGVLILLGEGQAGYRKRLKAIHLHYGVSDAPIFVCPEPVSLIDNAEAMRIWIRQTEEIIGRRVGIVILDTFSLMLGSGDESSNTDVGLSLGNARIAADGRTVIFVHHTGHGDKTRERGAYQIKANADVRILVTRDDDGKGKVVTVENLKQKDGPPFDPINLTYKTIVVGMDRDGDDVTSLVMVPTDMVPVKAITSKATKALDYVRQAIAITGSNQKDVVRTQFYAIYGGTEENNRKQFNRGWTEYLAELDKWSSSGTRDSP